ncbi:MAG: hypothetical protein V2A54_02300 [Bacteroidota bacterium]
MKTLKVIILTILILVLFTYIICILILKSSSNSFILSDGEITLIKYCKDSSDNKSQIIEDVNTIDTTGKYGINIWVSPKYFHKNSNSDYSFNINRAISVLFAPASFCESTEEIENISFKLETQNSDSLGLLNDFLHGDSVLTKQHVWKNLTSQKRYHHGMMITNALYFRSVQDFISYYNNNAKVIFIGNDIIFMQDYSFWFRNISKIEFPEQFKIKATVLFSSNRKIEFETRLINKAASK